MVIKHTQTMPTPEDMEDVNEERQKLPKEVLVIAQEVKIVQALACNDVNKRNKQIRKLRKWLALRAQSSFHFTDDDFLRIWKGLYYNMWMSDKPLVQEELAETMGKLVDCFQNVELSIQFFGAFLTTMCNEWFGIDQWRMDKFLMLVRRMLRYTLEVLKRVDWNRELVERFNERIYESVLDQRKSMGITLHYLDIFFEELAKVSQGNMNASQVGLFIKPFVRFLSNNRDFKLISHCRTRVFYHLLYQSELGREYSDKYNAWKEMGFPTKSINDLEKAETDSIADGEEDGGDDETNAANKQDSNKQLDPRAGNVDVFMPELPLDGKYVIDELNMLLKTESHTKCRKMLKKLLKTFETYQNGKFPLGVKTMPRYEEKSEKPLIKDKILQLENVENQMYGTVRKLKQLNKRKRRKLLKSIDFDELDEGNFEEVIEKSIPKQMLKPHKKKGSTLSEWLEEELDPEPPQKMRKKQAQQDATLDRPKLKKKKKKNKQANGVIKAAEVAEKPAEVNEKHAEVIEKPAEEVKQPIATEQQENSNASNASAKAEKPPKQKKTDKTAGENTKTESKATAAAAVSEWDQPLAEGELEYFIPSRKQQLKKAQAQFTNLVRNPFVKTKANDAKDTSTPKINKQNALNSPKTPGSSSSTKRVKIALKHNTEQKPSEYIKQIKSSPNLPFDANKKPGKGLLKPHSMPSPINPFYKKKIGLRLWNETL